MKDLKNQKAATKNNKVKQTNANKIEHKETKQSQSKKYKEKLKEGGGFQEKFLIFTLFVNLFDTTGTLVGVATRANLLDENGEAKDLDKALKADSGASIFGTFFGCSPVTSYVESSCSWWWCKN